MNFLNIKEELSKGKNIYELPLRVTYYARVSTDNELQTSSIINQVDYFKKYINNIPNWILKEGYIDYGISARDVYKRENFLKMIHDGTRNYFDLVLTKSVSRFARNTIDSIKYTDILLKKGIGVIFINDNINTLYTDSEFRLTLMASIAQDELRKLSESVKFGLRQSIKRGVVLGNNNILGYIKDKGKLKKLDKEVKIVKDIYNWFSKDIYTYKDISNMIYNKYNKKLDSTSIKRILTNYKYKGYYCGLKSEIINYKDNIRKYYQEKDWILYKDYNKVPPIIKEELWNKVQTIVKSRNRNKGEYHRKIYCTKHKRYLSIKNKKYKNRIYSYYICPKCCSFNNKLINKIINKSKLTLITPTKDEYLFKVFY